MYINFIFLFIWYVCNSFACMCVCALHVCLMLVEARGWHQISQDRSYREL